MNEHPEYEQYADYYEIVCLREGRFLRYDHSEYANTKEEAEDKLAQVKAEFPDSWIHPIKA